MKAQTRPLSVTHFQTALTVHLFRTKMNLTVWTYLGLKQANTKNPFLSYLNLNSLRYKVIDLREILSKVELEILAVSETKLSSDFPDPQFKVNGYQYPPFRKDRDANGDGVMVLVRNDLIVRR